MRVLLDQGLPAGAATLLRVAGCDAVPVREMGMRDSADHEIPDKARGEGRFCVTPDKDFHDILALAGSDSPSVVLIRRQGLRAPDLAQLLVGLWSTHHSELIGGFALTVTEKAVRSRRLPLNEP